LQSYILAKFKSKVTELENEIEVLKKTPRKRTKKKDLLQVPDEESPRRKKSPSPLHGKKEKEEESKKEEKREKDPLDFLDEEEPKLNPGEKDERLKILKKPKPTENKEKKPGIGLLTGIIICSNCSMIVKKGEKSEHCNKCQGILKNYN
jgi:hypothetical protein